MGQLQKLTVFHESSAPPIRTQNSCASNRPFCDTDCTAPLSPSSSPIPSPQHRLLAVDVHRAVGWVLAVVVWCSGRELAGQFWWRDFWLLVCCLPLCLQAQLVCRSTSVYRWGWIRGSIRRPPGWPWGSCASNQQATLLSMGVWALLWVVAQTAVLVDAKRPPAAVQADLRTNGSAVRGWVAVLAGSLAVWGAGAAGIRQRR